MEERALLNLDDINPVSLYRLAPKALRDKLDALPADYFEIDDTTLEGSAFERSGADKISKQLKLNFWAEYDRVADMKPPQMIDMYRVTRGICTPMRFYANWSLSQARLAWLVRPPFEYEQTLADLHAKGMEKLKELMDETPYDAEGNFDKGKAELQFRVYQHLDARLKGAVTQRIEQSINQKIDQRNLNINAEVDGKPIEISSTMSMEDIDREIARLEEKSQRLLTPASTKMKLDVGIDRSASDTVKEAELVEEERRRDSRKQRGLN